MQTWSGLLKTSSSQIFYFIFYNDVRELNLKFFVELVSTRDEFQRG